jgi:hypothetical protein
MGRTANGFRVGVLAGCLAWAGLAGAQALNMPRLKPLPPKKTLTVTASAALAAAAAPAAASVAGTWQLLTNQPPVLDPVDCGVGAPVLLTDGTVIVSDEGCTDWWI